MSFVSPLFLWALFALSIPVIIHLFNFRRTVRIFFSNTRLLRQVRQETTQRRRLKQYLVLASRLLFLFFLVIAFAQPFLPAKEHMASARNSIVYLDNSFSMSGQAAEKTRALDAAAGFVRTIVELFPADTRYKLITNDFAPFSNSFKTKTEVLDLLTQLRLSPASRTEAEIKKRIGADPNNSDIFWISDFQKSTWGANTSEVTDSTNSWHLIPISLGKASNVFVDTLYLENPFVVGGERNVVTVRLRSTGSRKIDGLIVKLTINDVQAATASAVLEPGSFADVHFDLTTGTKDMNRAKIAFNDFPVNFDNEFYFTLNFADKINVVEIKSSASPTYVERVYGNRKYFTFKTFQTGNVNFSALDQADLVVVDGVNRLDDVLAAALDRFRKKFGALLFIPGDQPDMASYSAGLQIPYLRKLDDPEFTELDRPDFQNPFFENVVEDRTATIKMPSARKWLSWGDDRSAILKYKDGQPFLSEIKKTFLLACPLENEFTDLQNQALFVPVMYRLAASGRKSESKPYFTLGENIIAVKDSLAGEEPLRLAGRQELIPSQRRVGDRVFMEIPRFSVSPGFYHVVHQRDTLDLIAFNLDKRESLLDQYRGDEVKGMLRGGKNISLFQASSAEAFSNEIKERYLGTPLWKEALALALLFLLAEVLLIRFLK